MGESGSERNTAPIEAGENGAGRDPVRPWPRGGLTPGRLVALAVGVIFLYLVRGILLPFVLAIGLAYLLSPTVDALERRLRLPRLVVVGLFYLITIGALVGLGMLVEPTFARDYRELQRHAPDLLTGFFVQVFGTERFDLFGQPIDARLVSSYLVNAMRAGLGTPGGAAQAAVRVVETTVGVFLTLVLLFYLLVDWHQIAGFVLRLFEPRQRPRLCRMAAEIHELLGRYVRGLAVLVVLMSVVTWLALRLLFHLPYALPIAVATGFLEIVPLVGPIVAGALATVVALTHGGLGPAVGVIVLYFVLRQVEDHIVIPNVVGRAVRLHPVVTIFAVLAGGVIAGVIGMLIAIPVAAAIRVFIEVMLAPGRQPPTPPPPASEPALTAPSARRPE